MKRSLNYDFLNKVKTMPPLRHSIEGQSFDINNSQAALWMSDLPEVRQKIFNMAVNQGVITYCSDTGTWQGVDYHED